MESLGPFRSDAIFADMSWYSYENHETLAKKGHYMSYSAVSIKTLTPTVASKSLAKIGVKVSVSTLCEDSQKSADAPLLMRYPLLSF